MPALLVLVALLAGWEAIVRLGWVDPLILPAPTSVAETLVTDFGSLAPDLWATAVEALLGLLAAALFGALIALAMHLRRGARRALYPLVVGAQALPVVVLAAPLILLLGFGLAPKVAIVALVCFFPVTVNLYDGLRAADPDGAKLLRSLGASTPQRLWLLDLPAALPQAFTGLRVAAAVSVIGAVFAEWSGAEAGLGRVVLISLGQFDAARTFAATVLLFVLAVGLYGAFALLERHLLTWAPGGRVPSPGGS